MHYLQKHAPFPVMIVLPARVLAIHLGSSATGASEPASQPPRHPALHRPASLHVHQHAPTVDFLAIRMFVRSYRGRLQQKVRGCVLGWGWWFGISLLETHPLLRDLVLFPGCGSGKIKGVTRTFDAIATCILSLPYITNSCSRRELIDTPFIFIFNFNLITYSCAINFSVSTSSLSINRQMDKDYGWWRSMRRSFPQATCTPEGRTCLPELLPPPLLLLLIPTWNPHHRCWEGTYHVIIKPGIHSRRTTSKRYSLFIFEHKYSCFGDLFLPIFTHPPQCAAPIFAPINLPEVHLSIVNFTNFNEFLFQTQIRK